MRRALSVSLALALVVGLGCVYAFVRCFALALVVGLGSVLVNYV